MTSNLEMCDKHQTHRRLIYDCEVVRYPDGNSRIITCSNDQTMKVYNYSTREFEREVTHPCSLYNIRSIDENTILTTDFYGEIIFWSLPNLEVIKSFRIFSRNTIIWDVLLLPKEHIMACTSNGSSKGQIRVSNYGVSDCPVKKLVDRDEGIGVLCRLKNVQNEVLFGGGDLKRYGGKDFGIYRITFQPTEENRSSHHPYFMEYEPEEEEVHWTVCKTKTELFGGSIMHLNRVTSIISFICPWNGNEKVVSGSSDQRIVVWYGSDGRVISVINGCDERISVFFPLSSEVVLIGGAIQTYRGKRIDFEGEGSIYSLDLRRNKVKKIWSDEAEACEVVWGMKWLDDDDDDDDNNKEKEEKENNVMMSHQKQNQQQQQKKEECLYLEPKSFQKKIVVVSNDGQTRVLKMNAKCKMYLLRDESIRDEKERVIYLEDNKYMDFKIHITGYFEFGRRDLSVMKFLMI